MIAPAGAPRPAPGKAKLTTLACLPRCARSRSIAAALRLTCAPPPAVMIDLAPLAGAPPAPPQEVAAPGPQMTEAQPVPTLDTPTPVDETPDLTPPTPVATPEPPQPDPAPAQPQQPHKSLSLMSRSRRK
jgi:hypothetical protein